MKPFVTTVSNWFTDLRDTRQGLTFLFFFFPSSSSSSSTSKWRKLFPRPAARRLLWGWNAPLLSWVELEVAHQMILCPLPHQEGCLSPLSHLVPQVPPTCPLRCPCPPCQWGRLLLKAYQCLIIDHHHSFMAVECPLPFRHCRFIQFSHFYNWCPHLMDFIHLFGLCKCVQGSPCDHTVLYKCLDTGYRAMTENSSFKKIVL